MLHFSQQTNASHTSTGMHTHTATWTNAQKQAHVEGQTARRYTYTHISAFTAGPRLRCVTEKQLFSTGPTGWLSARLLMTSIWGNHRFPVALIKSRLIKTFAIHPVLTL